MEQVQSTIEPRSIRIPNEQSQDLLHLSPQARKYVRKLCDSDFTQTLKDTPSNNEKRVSFSDATRTHEYTVLTGKRSVDLEHLPYGLIPSAERCSPTTSILKKEVECEIHEPPTRRHSFPFAKPKIRVLQRLSELVNAKRNRRGSSSTSSSNLESVIEEDNETAILDFSEPAITPASRRQSSPEIDCLVCPFQHPRDRQRRSSRSSSTSRFSIRRDSLESIRRGSLDLVKAVSSTVRRLSRGSVSEEEGTFEGPLWTDRFDLNLPESVRPDMTEIDFLARTQAEERVRVRFEKEKARAAEESLTRLAAMRARVAEDEERREREENLEINGNLVEDDFGMGFREHIYELEEGRKRIEQELRLSTIPEHEETVGDNFEHGIGVGNEGIKWSIPVY